MSPSFIEFIPYFLNTPSEKNKSRPWSGIYILKERSRYYRTVVATNKLPVNKGSITLTCHKRNTNPKYYKSGKSCNFRITFKVVNIFDPEKAGFFDKSNFVVKYENQSVPHTCDGYADIEDAREAKKEYTRRYSWVSEQK